ncbi:hypothetical protein SAMN05192559_104282 [Halobacillus karajensis]|uniref:Lipoprotein n=1 Tax=Halobacillus karajensis TaxID=195088 RepID=A0A024P1P9_9BACI|nr:hypothetical protein [Halobacillus karajensis]CDQ19491.1 hypothetical protein BN982_01786 [Halobacillus karajensis]CDQ21953.1 hypothetical protein BN983_00149 [Halobacillus karajensis]CDQ27794.1 hypothetical protein BN981_02076 [Halobacillus karajensis]SEH81526.1 hypothetical protein SAMN05192559_104282 [Halobacillus karajensis]
MKRILFILLPLPVLLLSGCLYPQNQLAKNQVPNDQQLEIVQNAVDNYQEQTNGRLPIKTKDQDTPIFQKYPIEFSKLRELNLINELPGTSFENGGHYQYVIIHPESNPTVKVLDLRTTEEVRSLQVKVKFYRDNNKYPPFGDFVAPGVYELDYGALGMEEPPMVDSPYSEHQLPVYLDEQGQVYIDYRKDLYTYLRDENHDYKNGEDIRYLLTDHTPFVPAYSTAYTIEDGEPVFKN